MGEVYRAHDSKLKRDVAVQALPWLLAGDPDRLRRFEQPRGEERDAHRNIFRMRVP